MEHDTAKYQRILRELVATSADIEGAALATSDGVVLAAVMPKSINTEFLAAHLATAAAIAESLIRHTRNNLLDQLYIKLEHAYVVMMPLVGDGLLITLCREDAKLGLVFLDMARIGRLPFLPAEGIIISRPPGSLSGHAKPEYDEIDE